MKCVARRMGDQYQCGKCGLQWDVKDEDRPKCSDKPRGVNQKASRETARVGFTSRRILGPRPNF